MSDYLLRAENESDMDDALLAAGVAHEVADLDGEVFVVATEGITLDRIGPIPAQVDEDGVIVRPGDNRYHANIRATIELTEAQVEALPTFTPTPGVPYRVFI
jgi:LmbE family N-acetylglucosaminyl deacetylase